MSGIRIRRLVEPETQWRDRTVIPYARMLGWKHYFTWRSKHSPAGFPDLVLVRPPRVIFAELKRDDGTVSTSQAEWLAALAACPTVESYVWRPRDWDVITRILGGEV